MEIIMNNWTKRGAELIEEISNTQLSQNELKFWFIGQCGFVLKFNNRIILIDPVLSDFSLADGKSLLNYELAFPPESLHADYIFCTHGHPDHFEVKTVYGLQKNNPAAKVIIPSGCKQQAEENGIKNLILLEPDQNAIVDEISKISVKAFSAAHPHHVYEKENPDMCLGYNISFGGIQTVHLGDTYLTDNLYTSLTRIPDIDLFFPPINGDDYFKNKAGFIGNMEAEEAAKLTDHLKPVLSVPTHFDMVKGNTADPERFAAKLEEQDSGINYYIPVLGAGKTYKKRGYL